MYMMHLYAGMYYIMIYQSAKEKCMVWMSAVVPILALLWIQVMKAGF